MITMTDLLSFWLSPLRPLECRMLDGKTGLLKSPPSDWQRINGLDLIAFDVRLEPDPRILRPAHLQWQPCGTKLMQIFEDAELQEFLKSKRR